MKSRRSFRSLLLSRTSEQASARCGAAGEHNQAGQPAAGWPSHQEDELAAGLEDARHLVERRLGVVDVGEGVHPAGGGAGWSGQARSRRRWWCRQEQAQAAAEAAAAEATPGERHSAGAERRDVWEEEKRRGGRAPRTRGWCRWSCSRAGGARRPT